MYLVVFQQTQTNRENKKGRFSCLLGFGTVNLLIKTNDTYHSAFTESFSHYITKGRKI